MFMFIEMKVYIGCIQRINDGNALGVEAESFDRFLVHPDPFVTVQIERSPFSTPADKDL